MALEIIVYCDANIFMDYFFDRKDAIRPLKDFAFEFFSRGWNCKFKLVVSDWLLRELKRYLDEERINEMLDNFKVNDKLLFVKGDENDKNKAKRMSKHWHDALHAILANKMGCDFLVTRNIKDFEECDSLVKIVLPESI